MPKEITRTLYTFDELSENAKNKVLEKHWDINVDHDWHDFIRSNAQECGIEIQEFDISKGTIEGKMILTNFLDILEEIRKNYQGELYKTAKDARKAYIEAFKEWKTENENEEEYENYNALDFLDDFRDTEEGEEIVEEQLQQILESYLILLQNEYEYQTSPEQVIESIKANEYWFYENGDLE